MCILSIVPLIYNVIVFGFYWNADDADLEDLLFMYILLIVPLVYIVIVFGLYQNADNTDFGGFTIYVYSINCSSYI